MPSTHFETTVGLARVIVDEPLLAKCDMAGWPIAACALAFVALVLLSVKPSRWHFLAGAVAALLAPAVALGTAIVLPAPVGDDGSVFGLFPEIQFPWKEVVLTVGAATLALVLAVTTIVAKKDVRLRVAASMVLPLAIAAYVRSGVCAHAFRVAIDDLGNVHEVATVDAANWPAGVHVGEAFAIENVIGPAVPRPGFLGFGGRRVDPTEWRTVGAYVAQEPGPVDVLLTAERGPVRVERKKSLVVWRDEGPSWIPLALGNTWRLTKFHGKPRKPGAVDAAFATDAPDPKGEEKVLRVARELHAGGLHEFVLELAQPSGATQELTVYRRDGELVSAKDGRTFTLGEFPLLGACRYTTKPIDDARTLAGPTVCGFGTVEEHYGRRGVVGDSRRPLLARPHRHSRDARARRGLHPRALAPRVTSLARIVCASLMSMMPSSEKTRMTW